MNCRGWKTTKRQSEGEESEDVSLVFPAEGSTHSHVSDNGAHNVGPNVLLSRVPSPPEMSGTF
jgi:hypothetical protein